ncbi:MAG: geranylgeranyl reductase family protein [Desulfobacteraceae bacterium]|nr:MAG: geranylgeranyl reductase family protein [Desulfobacteraceae bacterium]
MHDVMIVGAGPAGTAAAWDLLAAGCSVLLADKCDFPRKKACAGGITPKTLNLFRYDISPVIRRSCDRVRIGALGQKDFFIQGKGPLCHMTRREELDTFNLAQVIKLGARFEQIGPVSSVTESLSHVTVRTGGQQSGNGAGDGARYQARYLIGADGANSVIRRLILKHPKIMKSFAVEADVDIKNPMHQEMTFDFVPGLKGYYWVFPRDDHVNIGIYTLNGPKSNSMERLKRYALKRLGTHRLENIRGYPLGLGGYRHNPSARRVLLAGDAAGMCEPLLGEGLYGAVKSGQGAATAVIQALGGVTAGASGHYRTGLNRLKKDLLLYELSSRWFYRFPGMSLTLLSKPRIHQRFSHGFSDGLSLSQILKL